MIDIVVYKECRRDLFAEFDEVEYRWTAQSGNRLIVGASMEPYSSRRRTIENIELLFGIDVTSHFPKGAREFDVVVYRERPSSDGVDEIRVHT